MGDRWFDLCALALAETRR